jgi:hypothetical protein
MWKTRQPLGISIGFLLASLILIMFWAASCSDIPIPDPEQSGWQDMESPTAENLRDVFGFSTGDVFAVGDNGTILHFDGSAWTAMASGTTANLAGVWGAAPDDVFATGDAGTFLRYDGTSWTSLDVGTARPLGAISGAFMVNRANFKLFVVGGGPPGTVLRGDTDPYGNIYWLALDSGAGVGFNDIQAFDQPSGDLANFVAVADGGVAYLYESSVYSSGFDDWFEMDTGTGEDLFGVYGEWPNSIIAVGGAGTVIQYTGDVEDSTGVWHDLNGPAGASLSAIAARSYNDVFMVGAAGRILNYGRVQFSNMDYTEVVDLNGVWGGEAGVYAVGDGGVILRYTEPPRCDECPDNVVVTVGDGRYPEITWTPPCAVTKIAVDSDTYGLRWFVAADGNLIEPGVVLGTVPDNATSLGPTGWGLDDGVLYRITLMRRDRDGELIVGFHNHVPGDPQATQAANMAARAPALLKGWHYAELWLLSDTYPATYAFRGITVDNGRWTHWFANPVHRQQELDVRPVIVYEEIRDPDTGMISLIVHQDIVAATLSVGTVVWDRESPLTSAE